MRKMEKAVTDKNTIEKIIQRASVCRLGLSSENTPYIVPVCFGYKDNALYFHSSTTGRKLEMLEQNNRICFEMDVDTHLVVGSSACDWTMKYLSVIGYGRAIKVEDPQEKVAALDIIMEHYSGPQGDYDKSTLEKVMVIKVEIESMTGKKSGF